MKAIGAALIVSLGFSSAFACRKEGETVTNGGTKPKKKGAPLKGRAPKHHRDAHEDCSSADTPPKTTTTFKPEAPTPPGPPCTSKTDCKEKSNGRCSAGNCTYDNCYKDSDCKSGVCTCQEQGKGGWFCKPGNCAVDADCGDDGYCSPTGDVNCGSFFGVIGWVRLFPGGELPLRDRSLDPSQSGFGSG